MQKPNAKKLTSVVPIISLLALTSYQPNQETMPIELTAAIYDTWLAYQNAVNAQNTLNDATSVCYTLNQDNPDHNCDERFTDLQAQLAEDIKLLLEEKRFTSHQTSLEHPPVTKFISAHQGAYPPIWSHSLNEKTQKLKAHSNPPMPSLKKVKDYKKRLK